MLGAGGGSNGDAGGGQPSLARKARDAYGRWFFETPAITRSLVLVAVAGTMLGLFGLGNVFGENIPFNTVLRVQGDDLGSQPG